MYKLYIFLIAFVLFLFEITIHVLFDKSLDSNILVLTCIMILPGLFTLLQQDSHVIHTIIAWRISKKIRRRKIFFYFLERLSIYTVVFSWIWSVYLWLFFLIGNLYALIVTCNLIVLFLIIAALSMTLEALLIQK